MLSKKEILEWIDQASIDNYIPELQDTYGTEWIEKLKDEIISGRFDAPVILQNAVKEKIVEMIDKYSDHLKTPYVKGNDYLQNRYEGKIDALETLMIELMRDSILSK